MPMIMPLKPLVWRILIVIATEFPQSGFSKAQLNENSVKGQKKMYMAYLQNILYLEEHF
jgi:hypothetical protein